MDNKITNFQELHDFVHDYVYNKLINESDKGSLIEQSGRIYFVMCFLDMLESYVIPNFEEEYESDVENGLYKPEDNLLFRFFNDGHTPLELADEVFILDSLEEVDPFGFYSYQETWNAAIIAVQEFYKEVK